MSSLWPIGVIIYISGTVGEALGANLQRKSLTTEAALVAEDSSYIPRKKFKQKVWTTGFFLFVMAGIFMSLALFFASQTVLAPLQLFLFVSNAIFANLINKEAFNWLGWDGTFLLFVVVGVTMSIISAPKHSDSYSNDEMIWLMQQPGFIAFCIFTGSFIIGIWFAKKRILASCNDEPRHIRHRWIRTVLNMSYGAIAGAFGGVNVTLTKTVFSLIVGTFKEGGILGVLSSGVLWATSFVLIATYILQIVVTVSGLEITSAIIVISAHSVTEEVVATLGGILYFQDYRDFEAWSWAVFVVGNVIAIASVIGLSHLRLRDAEEKEHQTRSGSMADIENNFLCNPNESGFFGDEMVASDRKRASSDEFLDLNHKEIDGRERLSSAGSVGLHSVDEDKEDIIQHFMVSRMPNRRSGPRKRATSDGILDLNHKEIQGRKRLSSAGSVGLHSVDEHPEEIVQHVVSRMPSRRTGSCLF